MPDSAARAQVPIEDVQHLAWLARLSLTEAEIAKYATDLTNILVHVDRLNEVDVSDIEPTAMAVEAEGNVVRAAVPRPSSPQERILANAADTESGAFRVRAILEESA